MPSPGKAIKRRGRRQGEPVSRDAVLRAAKRQFAVHGYDKTTLRAIADDARVDPAMVLYLFRSKAALFRESMASSFVCGTGHSIDGADEFAVCVSSVTSPT